MRPFHATRSVYSESFVLRKDVVFSFEREASVMARGKERHIFRKLQLVSEEQGVGWEGGVGGGDVNLEKQQRTPSRPLEYGSKLPNEIRA